MIFPRSSSRLSLKKKESHCLVSAQGQSQSCVCLRTPSPPPPSLFLCSCCFSKTGYFPCVESLPPPGQNPQLSLSVAQPSNSGSSLKHQIALPASINTSHVQQTHSCEAHSVYAHTHWHTHMHSYGVNSCCKHQNWGLFRATS